MRIIGLGYLGIGAADPSAWMRFGRDIIGLVPARVPGGAPHLPASRGQAADGSVYFKLDDWSWRLAVHPHASHHGLHYMGLELAGARELAEALAELRAAGCEAVEGTPEQAQARAVAGIGFTRDPVGNVIELFHCPMRDGRFVSPLGVSFVTGDMGMGHLNLFVDKFADCERFYTEVMNFKLTDYFSVGEQMTVNFYHCNPRHHTLALMRLAPINAVQHILFQVPTVDEVGVILDRAKAAGTRINVSLGRHTNDRMLSFYMASPSGFDVEVGCDAMRVGPDWTPRFFPPGDVWGHEGLTADGLQDAGSELTEKADS